MLAALTALLCALLAAAASALPARFASEGPGAGQIEGEPQGVAVDQAPASKPKVEPPTKAQAGHANGGRGR